MRRPVTLRGATRCLAAATVAFALSTCTQNEGLPPPLDTFHHPVAGAVSPDGRFLYVLNSDFNLEFNGGMVSVVNLTTVRAAIASNEPSPPASPSSTNDPSPEARFIIDQVRTRPFGNGLALSPDGQRLFVSVRGDGTVTWIDLADGGARLSCGQEGRGLPCTPAHTPGRGSSSGPRALDLLPQPAMVATAPGRDEDRQGSRTGSYLVTPHSESPLGRLSLYYDDGREGGAGPQLMHWISGLSSGLWGTLYVPPRVGRTQAEDGGPRWLAFARTEPVVHVVRVFDETPPGAGADARRTFAMRTRSVGLIGLAGDLGLRDMVLDPCDPTRAYALARPRGNDSTSTARVTEQLLRLDLSDPDQPTVSRTMAMPVGVSRMVALRPPDGRCGPGVATRLYISLYDSRKVYVVDGTNWLELAQMRTQSGPFALVADACQGRPDCGERGARRELVYLLDFLSMCIEVIDVDPASPTYNRVVYTVGDVSRPRETL